MEEEIEDIDLEENDEIETEAEAPEADAEVETYDDSEEDTTDWKAEALKQKAINARMQKKASKPQIAPKEQPQSTNTDNLSREEAVLIAQGLSLEDIDKLKVIAKAEDTTLFKAKDSDLFLGYIDRKASIEKKEKAKLGSSKGSQVSQEKKMSELSPDEHKEVFKDTMSQVQ